MPQMTVCPSCAEHLEPEDMFCGNCGAPVPAAASVPAGTPATAAPAPPRAAPPAPAAAPAPAVPSAASATSAASTDDYGLAPPGYAAHEAAAPVPVAVPARSAVPYEPAAPAQPAGPPPAPRPDQRRAPIVDPREQMLLNEDEEDEEDGEDRENDGETGEDDYFNEAAPQAEAAVVCATCREGTVDAEGYCLTCGHAQPRERDHVEGELGSVAAISDRGLRHHRNEDAFAVAETARPDGTHTVIAVVCDGVSSASRPDEASAAASEAARVKLSADLSGGADPRQAMHEALLTASGAVTALSPPEAFDDPNFNAPACTCVTAIVTGDLLTVGWIGDSRAYWIPDDRTGDQPARLTEDDSWAARMVEAGLMSEADAFADPRAHAITGWLGADAEELDPHTASFRLERPGVILVCTDGLWNYAESARELCSVVPSDARTDPLGCARTLVGFALDGGGHDNVTVAVLPFPAPGREAGLG